MSVRASTRGPAAIGLFAALALLPTAAGPAPLAAQTPDTLRQDTVYEMEPIAVRAVRPSATVGGVSAMDVRLDSVRFRPAPLLENVLRELPLIQVRSNSRGEAQLQLRGAEERQIAILLDGIPLTLGWDHRTDLSVIPLTAARRIQVLRGLSSVLHGPNVLGGVVDIGTGDGGSARPFQLATGVDNTGGVSLGVAAGTTVDAGDGRLGVRGGMGIRQRDGVPLPDEVSAVYPALLGSDLRANSDLRHSDGFAAARYTDPGRHLSVTTT
ncbi:MAG: TonB-dependent receptor plug domain-containing protein, partial [Gemmatimonadota bacterium]